MSDELSLRDRITSGPTLLGPSVTSMAPAVVEVAGMCGCGFVWIDIEHASIDMMQVEHMCRAAELRGTIPLLRIQDGSRTAVLRSLEAGAKVIVVPQIHTPDQASAVAEYGKFPPIGQRGFNTASRGVLYGFGAEDIEAAFARANRETCLVVQIESAQAVDNAEAIIATEGIDGVLIGPGDLSASMGITGQWGDEHLITTIEGVFALARKYGKISATTCPTLEMTKRWKAAGANMLAIGGELALLRRALEARLQEVREL